LDTVLKVQRGNLLYPFPVSLNITDSRIEFLRSPFALKDEIKAMRGPKWHGFVKGDERKIWSIENHPRNVFQLKAMMGHDVYENWDQPLKQVSGRDCLQEHQLDGIARGLTHHYIILGAEPGMGKSLTAIEIMEQSEFDNWWYVGPASAQESFEREMKQWGCGVMPKLMSYEGLVKIVRYDFKDLVAPGGIILDEISLAKNPTSHRAKSCQAICDLIREQYGFRGFAIGLTGTPDSKSPADIWSQCEIIWPGFLREGSRQAFEKRYGITSQMMDGNGVMFTKLEGWDEEEVAQLPDRYSGLMTIYRKKKWLKLPEKQYETVVMEPTKKMLRVAKSLCEVAPNVITALTWCRALSSGFQYVMGQEGEIKCEVCDGSGKYSNPEPGVCPGCNGKKVVPNYVRKTVKVPTPKDDAVQKLLDRCDECGRIVIASAFQGSVDRVLDVCWAKGWATAVVDGRGWRCYDADGKLLRGIHPMDFWEQHDGKVAFVGNPESCGYGLTLTLAWMLVFYDNSFKSEKRAQMEDRVHRLSMTRPCLIVDLEHLPVDRMVIETLRANKKLEHLSLGVIDEQLGIGD